MTVFHKKLRPSSPTFDFTNRKLCGLPERDTPEVRAEKDRLIAEFKAKQAAKDAKND